ncbi:methyl-accepting chemotaxis protein [Pseudoroseicyclus sp. H15]
MKQKFGGLHFLTGSVFLKIAGLSALTAAIVAVTLSIFSTSETTRVAKDGLRRLAYEVAQTDAFNLAGHVRFANTEAIALAMDHHIQRAGEHFVYLEVTGVDGQMLAEAGDVDDALDAETDGMASRALSTGEAVISADGFIVSEPIYFGNDENPTGVLTIVWSPEAMLAELAADRRTMQLAVLVVFLALVALGAEVTRRMVGRPLSELARAVVSVSDGEEDCHIGMTDRSDEVGEIARALQLLDSKLHDARLAEAERDAARQEQSAVVQRLGRGLTALAEGDLTHRIDQAFSAEYEQLRADYNRALDRLSAAIGQVFTAANSIREGIGSVSASSDDLSRRTENQAATLEETATALDELTASVRTAADGSREVENIVTDARTHAQKSGEVVQSAVGAMTKIEKSSEQISQIIGVIDDIAFQTNLLALNAGVEAARAGEAGKGFAVVASEVRVLAQRTSDAAKEIKDLISGSTAQVGEGVHLVGKAGEALNSIVERVSHISELVTNIAAGTVEQANSLDEINTGVTSLDQVTQQNAAMVEESTAAAHTLYSDADRLASLVGQFQIGNTQGQAPKATNRRAA